MLFGDEKNIFTIDLVALLDSIPIDTFINYIAHMHAILMKLK